MKYNLTGVLTECNIVVGYEISDDNGKTIRVNVEKFNKLLGMGGIEQSVRYGEEYVVKSEVYKGLKVKNNRYKVVDRIYSGDDVVGYEIKDDTDKVLRVSLDKAWRLACDNTLTGVEAGILDDYNKRKRIVVINKSML